MHFKIHVPEIIKHHFHTQTVFIHIHPPPKDHSKKGHKDKLNHYEESNVEDWSSYNSYDNHGNHEEYGVDGKVHKKGYEEENGAKGNNIHKDHYNSYLPTSYGVTGSVNSYDDAAQPNYNNNYNPNYNQANKYSQYDSGQGMIGYMTPPQYAIHEEVDDIPNNNIEYDVYEEGHKRGLHSETGHLITKNLKDFYDDKLNEAEEFKEDGYHKEYDQRSDNVNHANYDKEIGHLDRAGLKSAQKRVFTLRMIPR